MKKLKLICIPIYIVIALIFIDGYRDGKADKKVDQAGLKQIELKK